MPWQIITITAAVVFRDSVKMQTKDQNLKSYEPMKWVIIVKIIHDNEGVVPMIFLNRCWAVLMTIGSFVGFIIRS